MIVIDCMSDTHCTGGYHFPEPHGDVSLWLLLHAGDFTWKGAASEYDDFLGWFTHTPHHERVYIAGNHERTMDPVWLAERNKQAAARRKHVDRTVPKDQRPLYYVMTNSYHEYVMEPRPRPHCTYLKDSTCTFGPLTIYGSPYSMPFRHWGFQATETTWDKLPDADIYLMHESMRGYGDRVPDDRRDANSTYRHVGSEKLLDRMLEKKPPLIVSGHIHEGWGVRETPWGGLAINAAILDGYQRRSRSPVRVWMNEDKTIDGVETLT